MSIFKQLESGVICRSAEETISIGRQVGETLSENQIITLSGDLGAGKTTFTKGIGCALGIEEDNITSPTFNIYSIHRGEYQLVHIDAYRLTGEDAMNALMIDEFLAPPWMIVVEWPEKGLTEWMEERAWRLNFKRTPHQGTEIRLVQRPE